MLCIVLSIKLTAWLTSNTEREWLVNGRDIASRRMLQVCLEAIHSTIVLCGIRQCHSDIKMSVGFSINLKSLRVGTALATALIWAPYIKIRTILMKHDSQNCLVEAAARDVLVREGDIESYRDISRSSLQFLGRWAPQFRDLLSGAFFKLCRTCVYKSYDCTCY